MALRVPSYSEGPDKTTRVSSLSSAALIQRTGSPRSHLGGEEGGALERRGNARAGGGEGGAQGLPARRGRSLGSGSATGAGTDGYRDEQQLATLYLHGPTRKVYSNPLFR